MAKPLDLEGLSDDQVELVREFVAFLRSATSDDAARERLQQLLSRGVDQDGGLSDEDAMAIAEEAVRHARERV